MPVCRFVGLGSLFCGFHFLETSFKWLSYYGKTLAESLGRIYFDSVLAVPMHAYIVLCHYLKLKKWRREMKEKQEQSCGKAAER